jgi:hypothetical protein
VDETGKVITVENTTKHYGKVHLVEPSREAKHRERISNGMKDVARTQPLPNELRAE